MNDVIYDELVNAWVAFALSEPIFTDMHANVAQPSAAPARPPLAASRTPRTLAAGVALTVLIAVAGAFLPKWLTVVSVVVGYATLLAVTRFTWSLYALPCWVAVISILVLLREYGPSGRRAAAA